MCLFSIVELAGRCDSHVTGKQVAAKGASMTRKEITDTIRASLATQLSDTAKATNTCKDLLREMGALHEENTYGYACLLSRYELKFAAINLLDARDVLRSTRYAAIDADYELNKPY